MREDPPRSQVTNFQSPTFNAETITARDKGVVGVKQGDQDSPSQSPQSQPAISDQPSLLWRVVSSRIFSAFTAGCVAGLLVWAIVFIGDRLLAISVSVGAIVFLLVLWYDPATWHKRTATYLFGLAGVNVAGSVIKLTAGISTPSGRVDAVFSFVQDSYIAAVALIAGVLLFLIGEWFATAREHAKPR